MDGIEKIKKITNLNQEIKEANKNNHFILEQAKNIDVYKNTGLFFRFLFCLNPFLVIGFFLFYYNLNFTSLNFFFQFSLVFGTIMSFSIILFVTIDGLERIRHYKRSLKLLHKKNIIDYKKEMEVIKININDKTEIFDSILRNIDLNDYRYAIENSEILESNEFNYLESLFKDYRSNSFECRSASLKNQLRMELSDDLNVELENY